MQEKRAICPVCGAEYDAMASFCQRDGERLVLSGVETDPYLGQTLLGQFRVDAVIGSGGMGRVYRAHQAALERDVAIKILHRELLQNAEASRRFQREARVAASLVHPHLVKVFLFGELPDGSLYLVMELLEGRSLLQVLREDGALSVPRALHLIEQVCDGVGEAHARGVVHRDVKPENVMVCPRAGDPDYVKVLDFGIARLLWGDQTNLTQAGVIFGTARYISPEGAIGEATDARSDVYSIGVLAYQLLVGETPFDADSPVALLMKHAHQKVPQLRKRRGGKHVPVPIADVVMRALSKKPAHRQASATELGMAIREAAGRSGIARQSAPRDVPLATRPFSGNVTNDTLAGARGLVRSSTSGLPLGEPSTRRGAGVATTAIVAFVLGAGAVTLGAWLVQPGAIVGTEPPAAPVSQVIPDISLPITPESLEDTEPEAPSPAPPELELRPDAARRGRPVMLVARWAGDPGATSPRFEIWRRGRRVTSLDAERGDEPGEWMVAHGFRRAGDHEVVFVALTEAGDLRASLTVDVSAAPPSVARRPARPEPSGSSPARMQAAIDEGNIDWDTPFRPASDPIPAPRVVEPSTPPPSPPSRDEPPAPWTGGREM